MSMEAAMEEIMGINHQILIARSGRAGVRKGGTKECAVETLKETEAWPITEEHFGFWYGSAMAAKEKAIVAIKALIATYDNAA